VAIPNFIEKRLGSFWHSFIFFRENREKKLILKVKVLNFNN
jgi:hypothetical protein